ncbi:MAG TPA: hypothetical protein VF082_09720 [Jiangellaceae bacterium]
MPAHDSRAAFGAAAGQLQSTVALPDADSEGGGFGTVDRHVL